MNRQMRYTAAKIIDSYELLDLCAAIQSPVRTMVVKFRTSVETFVSKLGSHLAVKTGKDCNHLRTASTLMQIFQIWHKNSVQPLIEISACKNELSAWRNELSA